jgi:hypothetical protein
VLMPSVKTEFQVVRTPSTGGTTTAAYWRQMLVSGNIFLGGDVYFGAMDDCDWKDNYVERAFRPQQDMGRVRSSGNTFGVVSFASGGVGDGTWISNSDVFEGRYDVGADNVIGLAAATGKTFTLLLNRPTINSRQTSLANRESMIRTYTGAAPLDGTVSIVAKDVITNSTWTNEYVEAVAGQITRDYGTYSPTLTSVANVTSSVLTKAKFERRGQGYVRVSAKINITTTSSSLHTQLAISLPIASDLSAEHDLIGTAVAFGSEPEGYGRVIGDAANNRALLQFKVGAASTYAVSLMFEYEVR